MRHLMPIALLALAAAAPAPIKADKAGPILVDGSCDDAGWARAKAYELGHGATLRIAANADFLFLCVAPPAGSYSTVDVYLRDADGRLHNLHASAQLGERVKDAAGWPDYDWWNNRDWYANPVEFTGMREGRAQFRTSRGREMQIARRKFPGGSWALMLEVRALGAANAEAVFPAGAKESHPATWATVRL